MRQIKASEVKPGMEVEFTLTRRMTIHKVIMWGDSHRELRDDAGHVARMDVDAPVTVVSDPQPEEPTEFGAKVTVGGRKFLRAPLHSSDPTPWVSQLENIWRGWDDLCEMGPVTVIPDQGWGIATDDPEVPECIEEWPEDDAALRDHTWRGHHGNTWTWFGPGSKWVGRSLAGRYIGLHFRPTDSPFTRVTDA